ncbi:DUF1311 domain-containing protein [Salmonella enterica subsp. enterica]|nr:DUF1311 domain-containing protein [Salmonella enterica subsp. enterica serovar Enteritidis]
MKILKALAPVLLWSASVLAAAAADEKYQACVDATGKNDEWARCGGELIARNRARLDDFLHRLREAADPETTRQIDAEQTAWEAYYATACAFYNDPTAFGREGQVLNYPLCKADIVQARAEQVRNYLREIDP